MPEDPLPMMTRDAFKAALEDILGVPRGMLQDTDTRERVEGWSSIVDVQILAYITSEFGLEPDVDMLEAESVGDLLNVLERRQALVA
jgi:acyl carrier protein